MNYTKEYDETSPLSIKQYAKKLVGKSFADVCIQDDLNKINIVNEVGDAHDIYENKKRKGGLGELIEEKYFHYKANNDSKPDFDKAGVELKVTPYKINKNGSIVAKERLIITMIDYMNVINEEFEESHLWKKSKLILLIYYLYQQELKNRLDYKIGYVDLFSPPEEDIRIIKHDFQTIINKIKEGKAHELSESDTLYLGAASKAATSKDRRAQPFNSELAKPRAFAFKNSYMTYVLNNYIIPGKTTYESILKDNKVDSLEDYIVSKMNKYKNYTVDKLCHEFNISNKKAKNLEAMLSYNMLGIKGNSAEEFVKANIVIKSIRLSSKNKIKESMSFPYFKFKELVKEDWETSTLGCYLRETRFLFVIYKFDDDGNLHFKGCQFWNIPYNDLEENVYKVWVKTKKTILDGIEINESKGIRYNNLPKKTENPVCHVRPHGRDSKDVDELPDGRYFTKQSFWLNNTYILSQINMEFLK